MGTADYNLAEAEESSAEKVKAAEMAESEEYTVEEAPHETELALEGECCHSCY